MVILNSIMDHIRNFLFAALTSDDELIDLIRCYGINESKLNWPESRRQFSDWEVFFSYMFSQYKFVEMCEGI